MYGKDDQNIAEPPETTWHTPCIPEYYSSIFLTRGAEKIGMGWIPGQIIDVV
jgi:hypothetical protein